MKKTATVLCTVIAVVAIFLLVALLLIGAVDMPVAEEGETLTKAQEFLVLIKTKTDELMSALGITTSSAVLFLATTIRKTASASGVQLSADVMQKLDSIENKMIEIQAKELEREKLAKAETEGMSALLRTFIASDLPASVRQELMQAHDQLTPYLKGEKSLKEGIAKKEIDMLDLANKVLAVITEKAKEENETTETETETTPTAPAYLD